MNSPGLFLAFFYSIPVLLMTGFPPPGVAGLPAPPVTLAKTYDEAIDVSQYWISEKLDGVRAYWDGEQLISRQGNSFAAPDWFTRCFPEQPLDGELWTGRNQFQSLLSIVKRQSGNRDGWKRVRYYVFDLPAHPGSFTRRYTALKQLYERIKQPCFRLVKQFRVTTSQALMQQLDRITAAGGEGLMLQRADATHAIGRSDNLLKLKRYQDAEARVLRHLPGKGKYSGVMGALLVANEQGLRFRIGTGFSDAQRLEPPPVGSLITYKYYGKTQRGIPRFASFMRIRELP